MMKGKFILHVLVSPLEIWEILMAWNTRIQAKRHKLMIGSTGNSGLGNPEINSSRDVVEAKVGCVSIVEVQKEMASRGILTETPYPTHGCMRGDDFYMATMDGNLISDWVFWVLRGMIYTDRKGRNMGTYSSICQVPWGDTEYICACRWRMRFTRGVRYKECQWGQLAELQIDAVALRRWILMEENDQEACTGERRSSNARLLNKIEERWEVGRTDKADKSRNLCSNMKSGQR